jgi:hypothetical protein
MGTTLSAALRDKYESLKGTPYRVTLQQIANSVGHTPGYITQLHSGTADIAVPKWHGEKIHALLRTYRFTVAEMRDFSARHQLVTLGAYLDYARAMSNEKRVREGGPQVRHFGAASAGDFEAAATAPEHDLVDIPTNILRGHKSDDVFALDIDPHSLLCPTVIVRFPPGARLFFHTGMKPSVAGQVVCARLVVSGVSVVRSWDAERPFTTVTSHSGERRPVIVDDANPDSVVGVLIGASLVF